MIESTNHSEIDVLLDRFAGASVVVVGDLMLDEYWWGRVERISPEAPVPVVAIDRQELKLGGAANVARNIQALGGRVATVGVIGTDQSAEDIRALMQSTDLVIDGLVVDQDRPTTRKTRIVAHNQQVVRADIETSADVSPELTAELLLQCEHALAHAQGIVISDYGKGVVTRELVDGIVACAREDKKFVAVDPKDAHVSVYHHVTTMTPNHWEAGFMAGRKIRDLQSLREAGEELLKRLEAESLLITRGEDGMALFEPDRPMTLIPTVARAVYDVTGAGDTVIAAVAIALAAGGTMAQAAGIANVAAGEVIKEIGTASTSLEAIRRGLRKQSRKTLDR